MCSKIILFLSSILLLMIMFDRIQQNVVFVKFISNYVQEDEPVKMLFRDYLKKFNKSYEKGEHQMRYFHFKENLIKIEKLNLGSRNAKYGVTKFSDWTREELAAILLPRSGQCEPREKTCKSRPRKNKGRMNCCKKRGFRKVLYNIAPDWSRDENAKILRNKKICKCSRRSIATRSQRVKKIQPQVDWRKYKNAVGPILDQKYCPVCWAFSIVGVMETRAVIQNYGWNQLSIQHLIDCSFYDDKSRTGCKNGRPIVDALMFLCDESFRVTTEANYPLTLLDEKCHRTAPGIRGISRFVNSCDMYKNESKLLEALNEGPVTAVVHAGYLFNYNEGIIAENCETTVDKIDHAIQIVGYDMTGDTPYYILKNSWGTDWGEKGYARLAIGSNQCGVAYSVGYFDVN